jgi:hypothetical protein
MRYLLPSLSMMKMAKMEPIKFVMVIGIESRIPRWSSSAISSILAPVSMMISGE